MQPVEINLRTKRYKIILDTNAAFAFQERAKKGLFEIFRNDVPEFPDLVILVWAMARTHCPHLTFEKLKGEVELSDYKYLVDIITPFMAAANFGLQSAAEGEAPAENSVPLATS